MSVATTIAIGVGVAAASTATGLYSAKKQSSSNDKAGALQTASADAALAFEKERDARDYATYQDEYARKTRIEDADRALGIERFDKREGRLNPYRNFGEQGLATLGPLLKKGSGSPLAPRGVPPVSGASLAQLARR